MTGRVAGKVALITGAGSEGGLGEAMARRLAEEGATVWLTDIDKDGVEARAAAIGGTARGLHHDVTSEAAWDEVLGQTGPIDILVNNAGIAVLRPIENLPPADYARQMEVNMTSGYLGMRAGVANMRAHGRGGSIINISSVAGLIGIPGVTAYAASKAGLRLFGKALAMETAKQKIRVNSVHPGMIMTGMQKVALQDSPEQYEILTAGIPMGYMGEPIEIANMVLFLASDEARYITGAEMVVDGGLTAQ